MGNNSNNNMKQVRVSEKRIDEAIFEALDSLFGGYYKINNVRAKGSLGEENARFAQRSRPTIAQTLQNRIVNEENVPEWYEQFMDDEYTDKPEQTPDYNDNIFDYGTVRYGMLAQSEDDWDKVLGQTRRGTKRDTRNAVERYYNDKLDNIIREAIEKYTYQDTEDEDSDIWDTGLENNAMYRVKWCIKRYDYLRHRYEIVSEESVECEAEQEAMKLYKDVIEKYKGCYALYITIEKEIDTLTGKRWERVLHMDGKTL